MIEHAEQALISWLSERVDVESFNIGGAAPPAATSTETTSRRRGRPRTEITLWLENVVERDDARSREPLDVRDGDGRVVQRQRPTRFFEVGLWCAVSDSPESHRVVGELVQAIVDRDVVPDEHLGDELRELGHPLEVRLVDAARPAGPARSSTSVGVGIELIVPFTPAADVQVAAPVVDLHLEMVPPPDGPGSDRRREVGSGDTPPRQWRRVVRREAISALPDGPDEAS